MTLLCCLFVMTFSFCVVLLQLCPSVHSLVENEDLLVCIVCSKKIVFCTA
jgi:hypothetical protein